MRAKFCTLVLVFRPTFPLLSQAASQDQAAQHSRQAQQYLARQRPDLAIPEFIALIALDSKNLDAQANLGILLLLEGDYGQAEPHLRAAAETEYEASITQNPLDEKAETRLGDPSSRNGDAAQALGTTRRRSACNLMMRRQNSGWPRP